MTSRFVALFTLALTCLFVSPGCKNATTTPSTSTVYWQLFNTANSRLSNNYVRNITITSDHKVWLATINGACGFDNGTWSIIRDSLKSPNPDYNPTYAPVNDIVEAKDRALWFCLPGGLVRFNQQSQIKVWTRYLTGYTVVSGAADRSDQTVYGELWFACRNLGVQRFEQTIYETGTWFPYSQSAGTPFPSQDVLCAATKPDDYSIWFGFSTAGMASAAFSQTGSVTWNVYTPPAADSRINAIAFDLAGNVWCGRDTDVVAYNTHSGNWTQYSHTSSNGQMPHATTLSIVTDYGTTRWFGTDSGLVRLKDSVWTRFTTGNSIIPNDSVTALSYDSFSNLWIGTTAGAVVYNPAGIRYK